jgi:hypothetical protein
MLSLGRYGKSMDKSKFLGEGGVFRFSSGLLLVVTLRNAGAPVCFGIHTKASHLGRDCSLLMRDSWRSCVMKLPM